MNNATRAKVVLSLIPLGLTYYIYSTYEARDAYFQQKLKEFDAAAKPKEGDRK